MAPASDDSTGRGSQPFPPEEHSGRKHHHDRPAKPGHPRRPHRARPGDRRPAAALRLPRPAPGRAGLRVRLGPERLPPRGHRGTEPCRGRPDRRPPRRHARRPDQHGRALHRRPHLRPDHLPGHIHPGPPHGRPRRPDVLPGLRAARAGGVMKASAFYGEQLAQVDNPDPFARPVWRSPVYHTPGWVITIVQLWRLLITVIAVILRHPIADTLAIVSFLAWHLLGWPGPAGLVAFLLAVLGLWRWRWPTSFARFIARPMLGKWRRWHYQQRWAAVMTIGRLAPMFQGRILLPVLGRVSSTRYTDRVHVRLVSGQAAADFANRAENLAHGFGAMLCRVRTGRPGCLVLEFVRKDALSTPFPALPVPVDVDLKALPVGRREDGAPWLIRLHGMTAGLVQVWAADPKLMELAFGRALFERHGRYAAAAQAIVTMLEDAVRAMQARASALAGKQRDHTPTTEHPFIVVLVDEVAFLTAYLPDKPLRERVKAALATLTTQGRAVGFCVVAALQDPRKE